MLRSAIPGALALLAALSAGLIQAEPRYNASTNYALHCQGCHGADGVGALPHEVPPLANAMGNFLRVPDGRRYLVQVPGSAYAALDDAALADLLNHALERFSAAQVPTDFRPYTTEDVASVRRVPADIVSLRARLVVELRQTHGICVWVEGNPAWEDDCGERYGPVD